jgi:hypothetical protein
LFSCTTWVIPLSSFTSTLDLRWIAIRIVPCFVVAILILAVLLNFSFDYALLVYVFWLSAAIRYFSIKRLICLKDLQ